VVGTLSYVLEGGKMNSIKHTVNGREYEIRSIQTEDGWEVATFFGEKRVSPRYKVSFETGQDFQHYSGQRAVEALTDLAKDDLDAGRVR
jgi:hypothetical protein